MCVCSHVEEECLVYAARVDQYIEQRLERGQLRDELLDHLGEGLEDGVVVDRCEVEVDLRARQRGF